MKPQGMTSEQEAEWRERERVKRAERRRMKPDVLTEEQKAAKRRREAARYHADPAKGRQYRREHYQRTKQAYLNRHNAKYGTREQMDARNAALKEKRRIDSEYKFFMKCIESEAAEG